MQGFGRWQSWLEHFFPKGYDFSELLLTQAKLSLTCIRTAQGGLGDEGLHGSACKVAFQEVRAQENINLNALSDSFSTPFDREDIFRVIEDLTWIAEYSNQAIQEMVLLRVPSDVTIIGLYEAMEAGMQTLVSALEALPTDRGLALRLAQEAEDTDQVARGVYEEGLSTLLVDGADPMVVLRAREIYHHLMDGGRRVRKAARVVVNIVIKDPS